MPGASPSSPIVLDTNVALDLLLFRDPGCDALQAALRAGRLRWLATPAMRAELQRVLAYPAIASACQRLDRPAADVLACFDRHVPQLATAAPCAPCRCADPDDQMFIDLAAAHRARLLSKDRAVLALRGALGRLGVMVDSRFKASPAVNL